MGAALIAFIFVLGLEKKPLRAHFHAEQRAHLERQGLAVGGAGETVPVVMLRDRQNPTYGFVPGHYTPADSERRLLDF